MDVIHAWLAVIASVINNYLLISFSILTSATIPINEKQNANISISNRYYLIINRLQSHPNDAYSQ